MVRLPLAVALSVGLIACTTITAPPTPESARITVQLHLPKAQVLSQVEAAFVAEDLTVAQASQEGGTVTSMPFDVSDGTPVTYRALLVIGDSGVTVVLTGTVHNTSGAVMAQAMTGLTVDPGDRPLHSAMTGFLHEYWQRIERIAARLRGDSHPSVQ